MKKSILLISLIISQIYNLGLAQSCNLQRFSEFVSKGKNQLDSSNYIQAIQYYNSAKDYCPNKAEMIDSLIREVVESITFLKIKSDSALQKTRELLNQNIKFAKGLGFSQTDSIALIFGENSKYGYMNKSGTRIIDYKYASATNFCFGVAKVDGGYIDTSGNYINLHKIDENILSYPNTDAIKIINLSSWGLSYIPKNLSLINNLHTLYLTNNNFDLSIRLSIKGLERLKHLKVLDLSNNRLLTIPKEIQSIESLDELYLDKNRIGAYSLGLFRINNPNPKWKPSSDILHDINQKSFLISGAISLSGIILSIIRLKDVGNFILGISASTGLFLCVEELLNKIERKKYYRRMMIPLIQQKNLKKLSLSNNVLLEIPSGVSSLTQLESLNISKNMIKKIKGKFSNLQNLKILDLSFNQLKKIPNVIYELKNLQKLSLIGNYISYEDIEKIKKLLPHCEIIF
jgi:Leucine-rich repeat (LRR) protein